MPSPWRQVCVDKMLLYKMLVPLELKRGNLALAAVEVSRRGLTAATHAENPCCSCKLTLPYW